MLAALVFAVLFIVVVVLMSIDSLGAKWVRSFIQRSIKTQWEKNTAEAEAWPFEPQPAEGLPDSVRRYLEKSGAWGRKPASVYKMRQKGAYRSRTPVAWQPVEAKFFGFTVLKSSVWYADITPALFISFKAVLFFEKNVGKAWVYFQSLLPLPWKYRQEQYHFFAAWQLAAQFWNPSIFQSKTWAWSLLEQANSALLQGQIGAEHITAQVFFAKDGLPNELRLPQWSILFSEYRDIQGLMIPGHFSFQSKETSGRVLIYEATITDVAYEGDYRWW